MRRDQTHNAGSRLKELRKAAGLTLSGASELSGVSISTLSKIENDQVSPSFDIIKRICDGLDVSIEEFVRPGPAEHVSGRKTVTLVGEGAHFTSGQYDYKAHATELFRKGMVPLEIHVRARAISEFDHWSRHRGEEFVYILSGAIEVHTEAYAPFRLERGESTYFDSGMAHLYITVSEADAHILSVSYDPEQGGKVAAFMNPSAHSVDQPIAKEPRILAEGLLKERKARLKQVK
jgi:transcriptional regulator with XRE-family HTH domain